MFEKIKNNINFRTDRKFEKESKEILGKNKELHIKAMSKYQKSYIIGRMLKAPPLIPRTYISHSSKIDPTEGINMFKNMFEKALK